MAGQVLTISTNGLGTEPLELASNEESRGGHADPLCNKEVQCRSDLLVGQFLNVFIPASG